MAIPVQSNDQQKERAETNSAIDHIAVNEANDNTVDKENAPVQEEEPDSPSTLRDKFVSSVLTANNLLHVRPRHVRKLSESFDRIGMPNIREE